MLKLSRKTLLTLEAVLDIAFTPRAEPVQAKELTSRQGVPQRYLEQVMQQLVRAGILKGVRGPHGGYRLGRERRRITVGDIVRIAESFEDASAQDMELQTEIGASVLTPFMQTLHNDVMAKLDTVTIEDLCKNAQGAGIRRQDEDRAGYFVI